MKKSKITIVTASKIVVTLETLKNVSDFSSFKVLKGKNRPVDEVHVQALIKSMQKYGTGASTCVIIETSAFDGIPTLYQADGQHRFIACERLGLGIDCKVMRLQEDTQLNVILFIAELNNSAKQWSTKNYMESFANNGITEYKIFSEYQKRYDFKASDLQNIFNVSAKDFKSGLMKFPNQENSIKLLDAVAMVKPILPNKAYTRRSLYKVMRISNDYNKLANQIIKVYEVMKLKGEKFAENELEFYKDLLVIYQAIKK
jgi:uncharacterized ParB-like nuclease family protein